MLSKIFVLTRFLPSVRHRRKSAVHRPVVFDRCARSPILCKRVSLPNLKIATYRGIDNTCCGENYLFFNRTISIFRVYFELRRFLIFINLPDHLTACEIRWTGLSTRGIPEWLLEQILNDVVSRRHGRDPKSFIDEPFTGAVVETRGVALLTDHCAHIMLRS